MCKLLNQEALTFLSADTAVNVSLQLTALSKGLIYCLPYVSPVTEEVF